jgi:tetratricopeptide (TPR) repeat protein
MQMKVGTVELETDPAQAFTDFQIALQRIEALPPVERSSLTGLRTRAMALRKEAAALKELGEYSRAVPLFEEALQIHRRLVAADPNDARALADLATVLENEAANYEDAATPVLAERPGDRRNNLLAAQRTLEQAALIPQQMLKQDPRNVNWKAQLANQQVRIGTIRQLLHAPADSQSLARTGLATLKNLAAEESASPMILDLAVTAILRVEPASLRDPQLAVTWAERGVAMSNRKTPSWLLSLAQAYRSAHMIEKGSAAANEGLALLPTLQPEATKPRIRKLLEVEAQTESRLKGQPPTVR